MAREESDDHYRGMGHALAIWGNWLSAQHDSWIDWREGTHLSLMILWWNSDGQNQEKVLVEPSVGEPWWKRLM